MVVAMMMQQTSSAPASQPIPLPSSTSSLRSPSAAPLQSQLPSPLSLGPAAPQPPPPSSHRQLPPSAIAVDHVVPIAAAHPSGEPALTMAVPLARVRLCDIVSYDGAPAGPYVRAVEALSGSLMRHNAAVIEVGSEDAALMRCGLESARLYFKARALSVGTGGGNWGKGSRGVYMYRAGRALEDSDLSPPCMAEVFRCMGKAARAALCAIARYLRLRSDVFNPLLDDTPLPINEASSSVLVATYSNGSLQNGKGAIGGGKPAMNGEVEKGLLTLISSDNPGLQVCDPNGRWYLADGGSAPGDLLLLTGKALSHATAGLRPAATYRAASDYTSGTASGRTSLAFRLMPQGNAILDCSPIAAAGHVIPQSYVPISVSQFMDDLSAEEDGLCNPSDSTYVARNNFNREPSLRSVLSDPLSGAFLEDAMVVSCGHTFGGLMLRKVIEMSRCTLCNAEIDTSSLIPNHALRAAAAAVKHEDDRRLFHNAALRKRRKEVGDQTEIERDEPVTPAGRLFLRPEMDQVINCVIGAENPFDVDALKKEITNSMMLKHPRFCSLMVRDRHGREYWRKTEIDIDRHIIILNDSLDGDNDEDAVNGYLADLSVSSPLSTDKPLWEIHLLTAHKCAVVRIHHALGDGISLMSLLLACFRRSDCPDQLPTMGSSSQPKPRNSRRSNRLWELLNIAWFTLVFVVEFILRSLWVKDRKTTISGGAGVELWPRKLTTAKFLLDDMKTVKNAIPNGTINDVLFGVISAGLSRYLDHRAPNKLQEGIQMTGVAMVNLRKQPGLQEMAELMQSKSGSRWGNKFGMLLLPVYYHKGLVGPLDYIKKAKTVIDRKKQSLEAYFSYKIGYFVMNFLGSKIACVLNYRIVCNTTFTISNVLGPGEEITIVGNPVTYIRANSTALPHAITMHMVSYAGRADLQILVAKDIIPDPKFLAKCFEEALLEMKEAAAEATSRS